MPAEERDPSIYYFPSCVLVKQCGGCCAHSGTSCTPTDETEKVVTVKKTKYVNSSKLQNLGDMTITIKEHNKCKCLCKKTEADCNSLQRFIKNQCRCECVNKDEEQKCLEVRTKRLFFRGFHTITLLGFICCFKCFSCLNQNLSLLELPKEIIRFNLMSMCLPRNERLRYWITF